MTLLSNLQPKTKYPNKIKSINWKACPRARQLRVHLAQMMGVDYIFISIPLSENTYLSGWEAIEITLKTVFRLKLNRNRTTMVTYSGEKIHKRFALCELQGLNSSEGAITNIELNNMSAPTLPKPVTNPEQSKFLETILSVSTEVTSPVI